MENDRFREKVVRQLRHPCPRDPILLAASPQRAPPEVSHMMPEHAECTRIGRHRVIVEVATEDLPQPFPLLGALLPQMKVKPRKLKVSGVPSPRRLRRSAAKRPNSMSRVFSGCSDSANSSNRLRISSRKRRASLSCWKPTIKSSAYRTMIMSPVASRRLQRLAQRSRA